MESASEYPITPGGGSLPGHIAIIMDGNGRWARERRLPRPAGHLEGVKTVRRIVEACSERGVKVLSLFAFSSENWQRPSSEVRLLLDLFLTTLRSEFKRLQQHQIRLRVIGNLQAFSPRLRHHIQRVEDLTRCNAGLQLVVAANYGGRWDILQAARRLVDAVRRDEIVSSDINTLRFREYVTLHNLPDPELLIRTGGEQRLSNFFLWQAAETVLYFSEQLWPDYGSEDLDRALDFFARQAYMHRDGASHHA